eukprot:scaffold5688_cov104-Cylindrotheca_fusiformis.AAC.5
MSNRKRKLKSDGESKRFFVYDGLTDYDPKTLIHLHVPSSAQEIVNSAFMGCRKLETLTFENGIRTICEMAFVDCIALTEVSFPSTLSRIEKHAFRDCKGLRRLRLNEGLQIIGEAAFSQCESLESVAIPSTVNVIQGHAFSECGNLATLDFSLQGTLKVIDLFAFSNCTALKSLRLPPSLRAIRVNAFADCTRLLSVVLPFGLEAIGQRAFSNCTQLTNVALPSTVNVFDPLAFSDCSRLEMALFPYVDFLEYYDYFDPEFPYHDELNVLVPLNPNLVSNGLMKRFYDYPAHELCYKQDYLPLTTVLEDLGNVLACNPTAARKIDKFGMTPFHVFALSTRPKLALLQALAQRCPANLRDNKDEWGNRAILYLSFNTGIEPNTRKALVECMMHLTVLRRLSYIGLPQWRKPIMAEVESYLQFETADIYELRTELEKIYTTMERYERYECGALLELAIWKHRMNQPSLSAEPMQVDDTDEKKATKTRTLDERQTCRIQCGAPIILSNVLLFLESI